MKKSIAAVVMLAIAATSQSAMAKSLEDVLKEKGVITEEDFKEVTKSSPISYKVGSGFTFKSPDDKFQLSLGGRLQARYTFIDKDSGQDSSEWRVRRMKMWLKGHAYTKDLTYKLQAAFNDAGSPKLLEDAFVNYRLLDELQIELGQDKVPFGRQEITSSGAQQFVDRSNATDTFKMHFDMGAMLHGKIADGLLDYTFGWFNGAGQTLTSRTAPKATNDNAFAARLVCNPLGDMKYSEADLDMSEKPLLSIGADYYRNVFTKGETNNTTFYGTWLNKGAAFAANEKIEVNTASADLAFKWMGGSLQGEYFWAQGDGNSTAGTSQRAQGFYAQAGYFVLPKHLELAVRYSYVDPNRDVANDIHTETQGAISYYFIKHDLKLQADISSIHQQASTRPTDDMQYRLQAQVIF